MTLSGATVQSNAATGDLGNAEGGGVFADLPRGPVAVALWRDVEPLDGDARVEGGADELRPFGYERALGPTRRALLHQPPQPADAPMRERQPLGQEATSLTATPASASCAVRTSAPKACGSLTARSARTLRSTSTPATWRPLIRRL